MSRPELCETNLVGVVLEGAYRITRLLGEGGMGAVYEGGAASAQQAGGHQAHGSRSGRNREALARFHREAEITSHLGHPHLVIVFDFGQGRIWRALTW